MRYVDDVETTFCKLNSLLRNNLEFLDFIDDETSELYECIKNNLETYIKSYCSFLFINNIPLDRVPDDIKKLILSNTKRII